ncbi:MULTISPECIES: acyl carrier protein [unclassified Amycolatopsis]|uniref:acyl carrier protein n=1 Tax=unclassified Amycolatopsis TaxID=2618356 RepID=UPI001FF25B40|nr:acyl carrier protein [Amycolatopsis sp. FBCC-B4732]UOX92401.1 acyl carrier protein [Amycolatopsis sp. FBCC-B4732]
MGDHRAEVTKVVSETFRLDPALVEPDAPLEELGIDSKGRIKLLAALEVYYGVTIDLDQLDRFTDVGSVAAVLAEALGTGGTEGEALK